jgi:CrcB protein
MQRFLWICLAGGAGTGVRYLIGLWAAQRFGAHFPSGTLIVNLVGCFVMGAAMHAAAVQMWPATLRTAVTVGFLGGFTTYSSFNHDTMRLMDEGAATAAGLNVLVTLVGGAGAGLLGLWLARAVLGR